MNSNLTKEEEQAIEAMETLSNFCSKKGGCEDCIFDKGGCILHNRDYLPEDWNYIVDKGE